MNQKISTNSYPGTRDFYPQDMQYRTCMFSLIEQAISNFGYEKVAGPLLESFEIYAAKSGEEIADKQLYVFTDKGDRRVAIRPELTPTIARMFSAKMNDLPRIQRWFSVDNFMRYERPQKGRLREFYQINVDLIGAKSFFADFEILCVAKSVFDIFDATVDMYEIRVNHKQLVKDILVDFIGVAENMIENIAKVIDKKDRISEEKFQEILLEQGFSEDQIYKLEEIFNKKFEEIARLVPESKGANELQEIFDLAEKVFKNNNSIVYDFSIVRGLDYYTGLVFEAYDKNIDNSRALFGGGRYDDLVSLFSKHNDVSGVGFAIGDVTFESFLRGHHLLTDEDFFVQKHMIAIDATLPLSFFYTLTDSLKSMENIFLDCINMLENIMLSNSQDAEFMRISLEKILKVLEKNAFFDKDKYGNLKDRGNLEAFFSEKKINKRIVEIFPDCNLSLGKQLQYANKSNIDYVWICGEPELKRGIIKRKAMNTGIELEFDLTTFEVY